MSIPMDLEETIKGGFFLPVSEERHRVLMANNAEAKQETRRCIKAALLALLAQERYEDIRMTDIIRKSGVSPAGVYNNYKSKDDIMLDIFKLPLKVHRTQ